MMLAIFALTKNGIVLGRRLSQKMGADLFANPKDFKKSAVIRSTGISGSKGAGAD